MANFKPFYQSIQHRLDNDPQFKRIADVLSVCETIPEVRHIIRVNRQLFFDNLEMYDMAERRMCDIRRGHINSLKKYCNN